MKMRILLSVFALLTAIAAIAQKNTIIENPDYEGANTSSIEITRIEVGKETTMVSATIWYWHNYYVRLNSSSILKGRTTGREYKLQRVEGVELDKEIYTPASNRIDCTMYFEPLSREEEKVDFSEGATVSNPWEIYGISLIPSKWVLQGTWEEVGNAGNVVAAFVQDRLLYNNEVWRYTTTKKGKNITIDITCGGVSRQLFAVQNNNGTLLLKKDKKEKGILLTRNAQTVADDAYTYDPSRAHPLFFSGGKVVIKGCIINNYVGSEQQRLMKILKYNNIVNGSGSSELITINRDGTFSAEFEVEHPHYVYLQEPLNTMVFVTPGDTIVLCWDTVESKREQFTKRAPVVLGNSLSAQLIRHSQPLQKRIEDGIENLSYYNTYSENFIETKEAAYDYVKNAAPLFEAICEKAPALLAGVPLTPVAKDIIITNALEELFTTILDVNSNYYYKAYKQEGNAWVKDESFKGLERENFFSFLKEEANKRILLDNLYIFCNRSNWVIFNRFGFELYFPYFSSVVNDYRNNIFIESDAVKKVEAATQGNDDTADDEAVGFLLYGRHYTSPYNAKILEAVKEVSFDSVPTTSFLFTQTFKLIEEKLGIGNCLMLQRSILETSSIGSDNDIPQIVEQLVGAMPFFTSPIIAAHTLKRLRSLVAEQEGGNAAKNIHPEVAKFLKILNEKYPGEPIILDFWGLGCGPCRSGMLNHRELVEEFAGRVRFVYICDESVNPEGDVNEFFTTNNIKGENHRVSADMWKCLSHQFNFSGIPHTEILLSDGTVMPENSDAHISKTFIKQVILKE